MDTPWIVALALGLVVVALVVVLVVRHRKARADLAARTAQHEADARALRAEHESAAERAAREATARLAAVEAEREAAREQERAVRRYASRDIGWDLASREAISQICRDLRVDGVLATNLMFFARDASSDQPFVTQLDHVLLLDDLAMVIENKGWAGVVCDGLQPRDVHPVLAALYPAEITDRTFAVRFGVDEDGRPEVFSKTGSASPASQVRGQAARLRTLVEHVTPRQDWFDTCVFYSNGSAVVHRRPVDVTERGARTHVVAGADELRATIEAVRRGRRTERSVPVRAIAGVLAENGASLRGFGAYEDLTTPA